MTTSGEDEWGRANQASLAAALARVRRALEPGSDAPATNSEEPAFSSALDRLVEVFDLTAFERDLLLLCAGVELDGAFAEICRKAGGPTFSLALALLPEAHWSAITPSGPLRYWRMIELAPGQTLTTAPLRIDERILHHIAGASCLDERLQGLVRRAEASAEATGGQREVAARVATLYASAAARGDPWPVVQLTGPKEAGAREIAAVAFKSRGLGLRVMRAADLPAGPAERAALLRLWEREAALTNCGLLMLTDDVETPDAARSLAAFVDGARFSLILAGGEPTRQARRCARFDLPRTPREEQLELWRRSLSATGSSNAAALDDRLEHLVDQFDLDASAIAAAGAEAAADLGETADLDTLSARLWDGARMQARARLDDLAQRIDSTATWDDLVLPEPQLALLRDMVVHVRRRVQVSERWGFAAKSSRGLGISALFAGASGTGKTLAAEILAGVLRLDLYRIDLSQVVSKYIGETEKNLRRVFDAAEAAGAVLLFDEADALFGKRSEVKDSHDRYANIEVSYLLQRMESYRGLAILTTNMKQALDPAFKRRIRFVVHFPFPEAPERAEIWRRAFPDATPTEALDIRRLAQLNIAGGNIRNIALGAAFLAANEERPVGMPHLLRVARAEYAKIERPLTDREIGGWV